MASWICAEISLLWFLVFGFCPLLTGHITDRSSSMIYPYFNQEHCTVKSLDISSLAGDWYLLYSKNPVNKEIKLKFQPTSSNTVTVETRENGNLIKTTKLTQNPNLAGKLEELKNMGTWTAGIPWFILDVRPGQSSMAIYHGSMSSKNDEYWAIYSKSKTLASADYTASVEAFNCAHLKNDHGNPIVIKATF